MKILLATAKPFAAAAVEGMKSIFEAAGHTLTILSGYKDKADFIMAAADADAIIVRSDKLDREVIEAAPYLKIVVRAGAGYDNLDLEACTQRGIVAMNTPGQNANAVAELALGMMFFMARTQFNPGTGTELKGKTIGIHAFGNVGRLVGAKAQVLGMKLKAYDPFIPKVSIENAGAEHLADIHTLYSSCDYVSIHIPSTPQTAKSINYELISSMPKGATLINTARKEVVDEDGLYRALYYRPDLKYATDIMPDNYDKLRREFGNRVFATPHKMGAETAEANINAALAAARQIVDFFTTGNRTFQLNR